MSVLSATLVDNLTELAGRLGKVKTDQLWIGSAYINSPGVRAIRPLLESCSQAFAVLGAGKETEPEAVDLLRAYHVDVRLRHVPKAEFHPKCYLGVTPDGHAWAAMGSANLTRGGARTNVELMTLVEGEASDPYFQSLLTWFQGQYRQGHPPTPELLAAVEAAYRLSKKVGETKALGRVLDELANQFAAADAKRDIPVMRFIRQTRLYTSYKLVILGTLLYAPEGRLDLAECAKRVHAFYRGLHDRGLPPERDLRGLRQLLMRTPNEQDRQRVVRMLTNRKGLGIGRSSVVRYRKTAAGAVSVTLARSLTAGERLEAIGALVDRLDEYYRLRVGAAAPASAIETVLRESAERVAPGRASK